MPIGSIIVAARILSALTFGFYGIACFTSQYMKVEFERYQAAHLRTLTGALQIAGALGIVAGFWFRPLLALSAGGLMLMMIYAVITRFKIRTTAMRRWTSPPPLRTPHTLTPLRRSMTVAITFTRTTQGTKSWPIA